MLSDYHRRFIRNLLDHNVRFLIIGGQARHLLFGTPTADLDLWVSLSEQDAPRLEEALVSWAQEYPTHTNRNFTKPLSLRPRLQLHFPEWDTAYLTEANEIIEIKAIEGVDVLTSVEGLDFDACWDRSTPYRISELEVRGLCASDLEASDNRLSHD